MKAKTVVNKEKNTEEDYSEREEALIMENQSLSSLLNLKDDSFYRQQLLTSLERIAQALERAAKALEESLENSKENETPSEHK